ncbi:hypothetical protein DFJ74DRAFT_687521 [Hyaloraphidium curvatum]|nr:hypothetical protein DFJ74DRAFT_687521 [Hyaloraphidium curvatum]
MTRPEEYAMISLAEPSPASLDPPAGAAPARPPDYPDTAPDSAPEELLLAPLPQEPPPYDPGPSKPGRLSRAWESARAALLKVQLKDVLPPLLLIVAALFLFAIPDPNAAPRVNAAPAANSTQKDVDRLKAAWKNLTDSWQDQETKQVQAWAEGQKVDHFGDPDRGDKDEEEVVDDLGNGSWVRSLATTILAFGLLFACFAVYGVLTAGEEDK